MNILFISGGNTEKFGIPPLVKVQGESLVKYTQNIIHYYPLRGNGTIGYLKNIPKLIKYLRIHSIDVIHAHYSFSGIIASLTFTKKPIIVSLLGSDILVKNFISRIVLKYYRLFNWDVIIVKSLEMKNMFSSKKSITVIPNGVDIEKFKPMDSSECKTRLKWDKSKIHILFAANPDRSEKNFRLANDSISLLFKSKYPIELHCFKCVEHQEIPIWLNASDVIILSSLWEGSPNVIKEAMACNRPIVSTNVGDIEWLFGNELGHFISDFSPVNFSKSISQAIDFSKLHQKTNGRKRIIELQIDSYNISKKITSIYEDIFI